MPTALLRSCPTSPRFRDSGVRRVQCLRRSKLKYSQSVALKMEAGRVLGQKTSCLLWQAAEPITIPPPPPPHPLCPTCCSSALTHSWCFPPSLWPSALLPSRVNGNKAGTVVTMVGMGTTGTGTMGITGITGTTRTTGTMGTMGMGSRRHV